MRRLSTIVLLFVSISAFASSIEVTTTPQQATIRPGQVASFATTFRNTLAPRPPITITATLDYTDEFERPQTATASTTLNVTQPVKISQYMLTVPAGCELAPKATLDGVEIIPTGPANTPLFLIPRTLSEGEIATLRYSFRAL